MHKEERPITPSSSLGRCETWTLDKLWTGLNHGLASRWGLHDIGKALLYGHRHSQVILLLFPCCVVPVVFHSVLPCGTTAIYRTEM